MKTPKQELTSSFRFNTEDQKLIDSLRKKTGVQSKADIIRMALRALAQKEGITK